MLTNKTLNANVDPSAIGGTYTWSAELCTCVTACTGCSCVSFTNSTGTIIGTDFNTVVTYPDDCTSIVIKLTIVTVEDEEQCVSTFYYNIVTELGGSQLTWTCLADEGGCMQIPSENQIFETVYDCLNCATCPCSETNICRDAAFEASYDCITQELTIDTTNLNDWCVIPYATVEAVDIVVILTPGSYTHHENINTTCNVTFPLVIDLSTNPLPNGHYFIDVIVQLDGCQAVINTVEVLCSSPGTTNLACCTSGSAEDFQINQEGNPPRVYTFNLGGPITEDIIVDFYAFYQTDKLSVYSSWDNDLLTGTEIATTDYIGACWSCCNHPYYPFKIGYYEREYTIATPVDSSYGTCTAGNLANLLSGGIPSGTSTPLPNDFSFQPGTDDGKCRLILKPAYVNSLTLTDDTIYVIVFSNDNGANCIPGEVESCCCSTIWKFKILCGELCDCPTIGVPEIAIVPAICDISAGNIVVVDDCGTVNGYTTHMQYSYDGVTWIDGTPTYTDLIPLNAVTQTIYTRCISDLNEYCYSDPIETDYIKPECCAEDYNYTLECNPLIVGIYNQVDYQFHVIYEIPTCDDTANPAVVEQLYNTPVSGDFAYQVSFLGSSVILDVYFNSGSEFYFNINCNLCWTAQYYIDHNRNNLQNAITNLLITHACEPCDITLAARYDYEATAYYISLDDVGGTNDLPATPVGQPPYTLTITNNNVLVGTADGVYVSYNRSAGCLPPAKTFVSHNISYEYIIDKYKPCTGLIENTNWNYGFFMEVTNPGQYVINVTDHDGCIAETTVCNITAELSSCTANALYATMSGIIHTTQTFEDIIIDGITYASGGIVFNVNPAITKAAILAFLNTIPIVGASFAVDIATTLAETQMLVITYLNCDVVASLEFNTSSPTLSSSVFVPEEPIINTTWTVNIVPAFAITSYAWSLGDDLVLVSGTLTDSTITTAGGGNLSVQVFTDECNPVTADVCIPTVDIVSCAIEHTKVSIDHLPGANALNYYFKGLVANGINISSANIQLVGSDVTAAAVVEANILSFLNTNLRPSVGGVFDVNYTSTPSTSDLGVKWYKCEGTITDIQLRLNESDNTTPANSAVNTSTVFRPNTYILTLDYSPNVPITSYTWTLNGPTLGVGELTDSIIVVVGGGDVDIEIEVLDCGTATDSTCIASIVDIDTACGTVNSVFSYSIISENDIFRGIEIGGTPYGSASIVIVDSLITSTATLIANIETWLNINVVPTVGGYFTAVLANTLPDPFALSITWTGCDTLLNSLQLVMEDTLLAPYYGSLGNTPTTIPDLFLIEALVEPAGTLSNEDWYATGAMVVEHVVSETQAYVLYGGAGTLTYSVDVDACGHATRTYTQV